MNNLDAIVPVEELNDSNGEWNLGPDTLMPSESFYSTKLDVPVMLKSKDIDKNIIFNINPYIIVLILYNEEHFTFPKNYIYFPIQAI